MAGDPREGGNLYSGGPMSLMDLINDQPRQGGDPLQAIIDKANRDWSQAQMANQLASAQRAGYGDDVRRFLAEGGTPLQSGGQPATTVQIPSPFSYDDPAVTGQFAVRGPDALDSQGQTYRGLIQQAMQAARQPGYQPGSYRLMDRAPLYPQGALSSNQAYWYGPSRDIDPRVGAGGAKSFSGNQPWIMAQRGGQGIIPARAGREYGYGNPFGYSETMAIGGGGAGHPISVSPQFGGNTPRVYGWPGQVGNWGGAGAAYY